MFCLQKTYPGRSFDIELTHRPLTPVGYVLLPYLSKGQEASNSEPPLSASQRLADSFSLLGLNYSLALACLSTEIYVKASAQAFSPLPFSMLPECPFSPPGKTLWISLPSKPK